MRRAARWGLGAVLLVTGTATGVAASVLHQRWWGLALGVGSALVATGAAPAGWTGRGLFVAGWLVAVGLAVSPRAEGDYLVPADAQGYTLLGATLVLVVVVLVTLPPARSGTRGADDPGDRPSGT